MKVICEGCGVEFDKRPYDIKRSSRHFCSRPCANKKIATERTGSYKSREAQHTKAIQLRKMGYGYRTIGKLTDVPWTTVRRWTNHIVCDSEEAYRLGYPEIPFDELKSVGAIRRRLLLERGERCEECGILKWCFKPIIFELHHIDGNRTNNFQDNLLILCPNCHSQTDNYRNKSRAA